MMIVSSGPRRLACLAGAALVLAIAGAAANPQAALAQARTILPVVNNHAAVSWGLNDEGELGNGTQTNSSRYGGVSGLGTGVVQVSAGGSFSLALTSAGTVWAWGLNFFGVLGDGTETTSLTPVRVTGLSGIIQVVAGGDHALALGSNGTVWAWGCDLYGQLGDGMPSSMQFTPVKVPGLTGVTKIAAGESFSLALRSDGTVWAWGDNSSGGLGDGTTAGSSVPVHVTGLSQVTSIAAGLGTAYAIRTSSITARTSVWAWGENNTGELGDGTTTGHLIPEQVTGITAPGIVGITAGQGFAEALGSDGSVWGWGDDGWDQLGFQPPPVSNLVLKPVQTIGAGSNITQLSAGYKHVLALESNGTVLAWGSDVYGQLGNGTTGQASTPVQVSGLTGASQVAAGNFFSLAVYLPPQYR
jgi:alpha-tubulin suppressor-like RCC1 family protein